MEMDKLIESFLLQHFPEYTDYKQKEKHFLEQKQQLQRKIENLQKLIKEENEKLYKNKLIKSILEESLKLYKHNQVPLSEIELLISKYKQLSTFDVDKLNKMLNVLIQQD